MSNLILYDYREVSRIHHWPFESPLALHALTVAETDFFGVPSPVKIVGQNFLLLSGAFKFLLVDCPEFSLSSAP
jgi:hypothetical protein